MLGRSYKLVLLQCQPKCPWCSFLEIGVFEKWVFLIGVITKWNNIIGVGHSEIGVFKMPIGVSKNAHL